MDHYVIGSTNMKVKIGSNILVSFRVFVLLLAMGQKSLSGPSAVSIMESLLDMLARVLSPLMAGQSGTCTYTTPLQYLL